MVRKAKWFRCEAHNQTKMKKETAWIKHLMEVYAEMKKENPEIKLCDAMKEAKKTYVKPQP